MKKEVLLEEINKGHEWFDKSLIENDISCFRGWTAMLDCWSFKVDLFNKFLFENDLLSKKIEFENGELIYEIIKMKF